MTPDQVRIASGICEIRNSLLAARDVAAKGLVAVELPGVPLDLATEIATAAAPAILSVIDARIAVLEAQLAELGVNCGCSDEAGA
jgi:hypothetical protein